MDSEGKTQTINEAETDESRRMLDSLEFFFEYMLKNKQSDQAPLILNRLIDRLRESGVRMPETTSTPYTNTIPPEE